MKRYLRLYLYFLRFSFSKAMEFRIDFTFRIVMDCIYYVVNILFFKVIYLHTPMLGGWREDEIMVFVGAYILIDAINMTIFSTNLWWLPWLINKGELDYYLIRPVNPLFFLSLREFSANSFMNLIIAAGFLIYTLIQYQGSFGAAEIFLFLALILNGSLLYFCIQMLTILPVFWTQSTRGFVDLFYTLGLAMERPHRIYRGFFKILFTTLLPFALIASFPVKVFLEGPDLMTMLHLTAVTISFFALLIFVWGKGLRNYSSASS
ncbi:MAG: ABC-2 family transporter protein [Bdellovibrionota bacterium]